MTARELRTLAGIVAVPWLVAAVLVVAGMVACGGGQHDEPPPDERRDTGPVNCKTTPERCA